MSSDQTILLLSIWLHPVHANVGCVIMTTLSDYVCYIHTHLQADSSCWASTHTDSFPEVF